MAPVCWTASWLCRLRAPTTRPLMAELGAVMHWASPGTIRSSKANAARSWRPNCFWRQRPVVSRRRRGGRGHDDRGRIVESSVAALRNKQPVSFTALIDAAAKCRRPKLERNLAMISISRSIILAASLVAFPLAGAMAHATFRSRDGKSTGPSSASGNSSKTVVSNNGGNAMKSDHAGYGTKCTVSGAVGEARDNAANRKIRFKQPVTRPVHTGLFGFDANRVLVSSAPATGGARSGSAPSSMGGAGAEVVRSA